MSDNPFVDDIADVELPVLQSDLPERQQASKGATSSVQSGPQTPEKLQQRLQALKDRERQLNHRRQEIAGQQHGAGPKLNWPSFFAILRYDPESDIPVAARSCVKMSLIGLVLFAAHAFWNVISVFSVNGLKSYPFAKCIVFAIIFGVVTFFLVLNFGYKKLYISCAKHDIPVSWTFIQFAIILWCVYLLIGLPDSGSVGVAVLLDLIASKTSNAWSKIAAVINTAIIAATALCQFTVLVQSQKYQKVSGRDEPLATPETPLNV